MRALAIGGAISSLFAGAAANAEPPRVELRYQAPSDVSGCLSEPAFQNAVRQRLSFDPFSSRRGAAIVVVTHIARDGRRLRATISLEDPAEPNTPGRAIQEIFSDSNECATLSAAAALAVSMTIERSAVEAPPPRPAGDSSPSASAELPSSRSRGAPSAPPTRADGSDRPARADGSDRPARARSSEALDRGNGDARAIDLRTHAGVLFGFGILPAPSAGAVIGASAEHRRWAGGLEAGAWLSSEVTSPRGGGADARLLFLSATICGRHERLFACGVATAGELRATGTDLRLSRSSGSTYGAVGGRAGVELPLPAPFSIVLQAGVVAPLVRTTLRIGDEVLWRAPLAGLELGAIWRITIL